MGRATTTDRYSPPSKVAETTQTQTQTQTQTPTPSKIHYSGMPQRQTPTPLTGYYQPTGGDQTRTPTGGYGHQGITTLYFEPIIKPSDTTMSDFQFDALVNQVGEDQALKLASATYLTTQEFQRRFPTTEADLQSRLNEINEIEAVQRQLKNRPMPPPEQTIVYRDRPAPASSAISVLPFAIIGIVLIGILLFLRRRA